MHTQDIAIDDDSIKLGQFLKLSGLAETGGEAKELIASNMVHVNGKPVAKRGSIVHQGDIISVIDPTSGSALKSSRIVESDDEDDDDFDPEKWRNL